MFITIRIIMRKDDGRGTVVIGNNSSGWSFDGVMIWLWMW
jgi:hypothetical protein